MRKKISAGLATRSPITVLTESKSEEASSDWSRMKQCRVCCTRNADTRFRKHQNTPNHRPKSSLLHRLILLPLLKNSTRTSSLARETSSWDHDRYGTCELLNYWSLPIWELWTPQLLILYMPSNSMVWFIDIHFTCKLKVFDVINQFNIKLLWLIHWLILKFSRPWLH